MPAPIVGLAAEAVHSLLEGAKIDTPWRCKVFQPLMEVELVRSEEELEARVLAGRSGTKLHVTGSGAEQREDLLLKAMSEWLKNGETRGLGMYFPKDWTTSTTTQVNESERKLCANGRHHLPV